MDKHHVGFFTEIREGSHIGSYVKYDVYHICSSNNGKVVAFVCDYALACKIVDLLNGVDQMNRGESNQGDKKL